MSDKVSGIREGEEIWISWKEDNEQVVNGFVILLSCYLGLLNQNYNNVIIFIGGSYG